MRGLGRSAIRSGRKTNARWARDDAVIPLVAVVILVGAAIAGGAGVYAWVTKFQADGSVAPAIAFARERSPCGATYVVAAADHPLPMTRFTIRPEGGQGATMIAFGTHAAQNATWAGSTSDGVLLPGSEIRLWAEGPTRTFDVLDGPSQGLVARLDAPDGGADATQVAITVHQPTTSVGGYAQLTGTAAQAGCSGIASVNVVLDDATTGLAWDGVTWSPIGTPLAAALDRPGASSTSWSLALANVTWSPTHDYALQFAGVDGAGTPTTTATSDANSASASPQPASPVSPSSAWDAAQLTPSDVGNAPTSGSGCSAPSAPGDHAQAHSETDIEHSHENETDGGHDDDNETADDHSHDNETESGHTDDNETGDGQDHDNETADDHAHENETESEHASGNETSEAHPQAACGEETHPENETDPQHSAQTSDSEGDHSDHETSVARSGDQSVDDSHSHRYHDSGGD